MSSEDFIPYMGYEWVQVDGDIITIGISEEGLDEFSEINAIHLPEESSKVLPDEVCGEIDTDQGPLNLYSPIKGKVIEVNSSIMDDPKLIQEDPLGEGWLFRVEARNPEDIEELTSGRIEE